MMMPLKERYGELGEGDSGKGSLRKSNSLWLEGCVVLTEAVGVGWGGREQSGGGNSMGKGPSGVMGRRAEMRLESGQRPTHMWPGRLGETSKEQWESVESFWKQRIGANHILFLNSCKATVYKEDGAPSPSWALTGWLRNRENGCLGEW